MKPCSVCGCYHPEDADVCSICGVRFPRKEPSHRSPLQKPVVSAPPRPSTLPTAQRKVSSDPKADRMAIAGFVLSLMGLSTFLTTPLQLAALLLSLYARNTSRCKGLRKCGIIFSIVALCISFIFWIVFLIFICLGNLTDFPSTI